jgi:UDP-N-acetylmuramate-alanine ligase
MDHPDVRYIPALDDAAKALIARLKSGDVLLTLGAGDGHVVGQAVLDALGSAQ